MWAGSTGRERRGRTLLATDEVVIEATGNCMAVSRVLAPFMKRVVIANPLQVKAIAHAHVKTDKIDAGTLASLYAAGYLRRSGHRMPPPSEGWSRGATRSCGIGPGSRTRCIRSSTPT